MCRHEMGMKACSMRENLSNEDMMQAQRYVWARRAKRLTSTAALEFGASLWFPIWFNGAAQDTLKLLKLHQIT